MRPIPVFRSLALGVATLLGSAGCALPPAEPSPPSPPVDVVPAPTGTAEASAPLVNFELGPHRFTLPANYFVDGGGPDFQGSVTLALHWPSLEPYPPAQPYASFTTGPMRNQRVLVSVRYIDRVPIDELPERHVTLRPGQNADDPGENLALRDRLPDRFGLEHYVVNFDKFHAWINRFPDHRYVPKEDLVGRTGDWFIARDMQGRVRTAVRCDDSREPEGEEIRGDALVEIPGRTQSPQCGAHLFAIPEYSLEIDAGYARPLLRDWQKIEATVRQLIHEAHRRATPAPGGSNTP